MRVTKLLPLLLSLSAIGACSLLPLVVDTKATAPALDGFGAASLESGSTNQAARKLFAQGVAQAYGFNEAEAVRSFKAALAKDPSCAMCAWGVAWQMGPTINSGRGDLKEAVRYVDYAVKHGKDAAPRDQALIQSLALRYGHQAARSIAPPPNAEVCTSGAGKADPVNPLDAAYADFMRDLQARFPADPDVLALYAEAEMIITRGDWWDPVTGKPAGRIGQLGKQIEAALAAQPEHVGLNHYMIHAFDATQVAKRAEAAADRLGALAPKSPHLLHMPSHTYAHLGRYGDAARINQQAVAADVAMAAELKRQGFADTKDWRGHNLHFQWYAALMDGRSDLALETTRAHAARSQGNFSYHEYVRSLPILTLLHLQRWDEVLAEAPPKSKDGLEQALHDMARGIVLARQGKLADAKSALERIKPITVKLMPAKDASGFMANITRSLLASTEQQLAAEVAFQEGRIDEALALQEEAVKSALFAEGREPPSLASGPRLRLGDMQLRAKRAAEAEKTFRADLAERPGNHWALKGLQQAIEIQSKSTRL